MEHKETVVNTEWGAFTTTFVPLLPLRLQPIPSRLLSSFCGVYLECTWMEFDLFAMNHEDL
jgi:hypothetical protein